MTLAIIIPKIASDDIWLPMPNVEVTGAARIYCAASVLTAGLGHRPSFLDFSA